MSRAIDAGSLMGWVAGALLLVLGVVPRVAAAEVVEYIHTDALGSPVAVTNASGVVIERTVYGAYGEVINRPLAGGPGYTGHVEDAETGLNYMQQRYYDPMIGRFLSVDPVTANTGTGANFNRYWYANNNPYRFKDPDGRKCATIDGQNSCTFDEFKDKVGDTITRDQATSWGSKLAKFFGADRGSRIRRAEKAMTAKYSAARNLAASGDQVTIKGDSKLGIPDQNVSGASIVSRMETTRTIANEGGNPMNAESLASTSVFVGTGYAPNTPINFWKDGGSGGAGHTFGHEILHTTYSGVGVPNGGWTNGAYNMQHQEPFNDASDSIK